MDRHEPSDRLHRTLLDEHFRAEGIQQHIEQDHAMRRLVQGGDAGDPENNTRPKLPRRPSIRVPNRQAASPLPARDR
jgi:hypothetical protein